MKEIVIQHFFEGHATAEDLAADAADAFRRQRDKAGAVYSQLDAVPMNHEFHVVAAHIVKLVDAVQSNIINLDALDAICFCLEATNNFTWDADTSDGSRVANGVFWLGTPEINYPLTPSVIEKIRHYLLTGEETFTQEDLGSPLPRPELLTVNEWDRRQDV